MSAIAASIEERSRRSVSMNFVTGADTGFTSSAVTSAPRSARMIAAFAHAARGAGHDHPSPLVTEHVVHGSSSNACVGRIVRNLLHGRFWLHGRRRVPAREIRAFRSGMVSRRARLTSR
jgi:hypothetical protein